MSLLTTIPYGDDAMHSLPKPTNRTPDWLSLSQHEKFLLKVAGMPTAMMYDMTDTVFTSSKHPVTIRCIMHGEFEVKQPSAFVTRGVGGCSTCNREFGMKELDHAEVILVNRYIAEQKRELEIEAVMMDDDPVEPPIEFDHYDGELHSNALQYMLWQASYDYQSHQHNTRAKFNY